MPEHEFDAAVINFITSFEEVFHRDWERTKATFGAGPVSATFIEHGLQDESVVQHELVDRYRVVVAQLKTRGRPRSIG